MSKNIIWETNGTVNHLLALDEESKRAELIDYGYEKEMLDELDDKGLDQLILDDDYLWQIDVEDFEYNIAPEIERQTEDGTVIMSGYGETWTGKHAGGKVVSVGDLVGGDIASDVDEVIISEEDGGLVWEGVHHDGVHRMKLYAGPKAEDFDQFAKICMSDYIENEKEFYPDETEDDIIADLALDWKQHDDEIDFSKVDQVCDRITFNKVNEELAINEVKENEPRKLTKELKEIKKLSDEHGYEYFTIMPFTAYDNDPESIEYKYPHFFKVVKAFFKEMGIIDKEDLDNPDVLDDEWYSDIDQHDWDTLMRVCDLLVNHRAHAAQIEKIYKNDFNDGIDDARILADREEQELRAAEYGESLKEAISGNSGYTFNMGNIEDTLEMYLEWEGISVALDYDDILPFKGDYRGLKELLEELGIRGYTNSIYDILEGGDAYCPEMKESDFIKLCDDFGLQPYKNTAYESKFSDEDKDEYIKEWAKGDYEVGHPMDSDDFNEFKHMGYDDGYNLIEEDFDKYFEYYENCKYEDDEIDESLKEGLNDSPIASEIEYIADIYSNACKDPKEAKEAIMSVINDLVKQEGSIENAIRKLSNNLDSSTDESLKEEIQNVAKENADKFVKYLADHDVKSGGYGEKDPEVKELEDGICVHLYSQVDDIEIHFLNNGNIVYVEDTYDYENEDEAKEITIKEEFNNWSDFVKWLKNGHWFWSDDLGADLEEAKDGDIDPDAELAKALLADKAKELTEDEAEKDNDDSLVEENEESEITEWPWGEPGTIGK